MKILKKIIALTLSAVVGVCAVSCGDTGSSSGSEKKISGYENTGKFVISLYPEYAPITCENFEKLVSDGFYDGLTFHRVRDNFMAQGGDPKGDGTGGLDEKIKGEFSSNGVDNKLSHKRGIVSMARAAAPDSASCQFFICYSDDYASTLDGKRTKNARGETAVPVYPITIDKAVMLETKDGEPHQAEFTVTYSPRGK